jgi:Cu(I)/Ag(I) efflux system protein CusF
MKLIATLSLATLMSTSGFALAQNEGMKGMVMNKMDPKSMESDNCMNMKGMKGKDMPGMDMKNMTPGKCNEMMKGMKNEKTEKDATGMTHQADGVVKSVDTAKGIVTLAHKPVATLGWPAMSMGFAVKDKSMLDKLTVGKNVHVGFKKQGDDYVITSVK